MEILKKLQKLEGMDLLIDQGGSVDFPPVEINNCIIGEYNNKFFIQDEDDDGKEVAINKNKIDYIEVLHTGEQIIHSINDYDIRIMFH